MFIGSVGTKVANMIRPTISICQMCVSDNKINNFAQAKRLIEESKKRGAVMAFLPEACDYIATNATEAVNMAEPVDIVGDTVLSRYSSLAKEINIWISLGGIHTRCDDDPIGKIRNTHVILDNGGNIQALYDKCHLFSVDIPNKVALKETDTTVPGKKILQPVSSPVGRIGVMVCYDLRFPQISTILRQQGADILTYPSAFTIPTGRAHWEVLLRARAIENQCFVVAAAQTGEHNPKRSSYGHSMIVDPWGKILATSEKDEIGVVTAEIDGDYLKQLRIDMPVLEHARRDIYP